MIIGSLKTIQEYVIIGNSFLNQVTTSSYVSHAAYIHRVPKQVLQSLSLILFSHFVRPYIVLFIWYSRPSDKRSYKVLFLKEKEVSALPKFSPRN